MFSNIIKIKSMGKVNKIVKAASNTKSIIGFELTIPAVIAFVAYIILALVVILPFEFPVTDERTGQVTIVKYNLGERIIVLLLLAIPIALSVYSINCMMAGNCLIWSYIVSIISVFWVVLFIISALVYTFKKKSDI